MRDLIPWGRSRTPQRFDDRRSDEASPFLTLHREMNRLFDDAFRGFGLNDLTRGGGLGWPQVEVTDFDKELRVTAELPGLDEADVEIRIEDNVLSLRGEKHAEHEDKDRRYSERYYGQFERRIVLPSEVDDERANATFRNGVLTITLPKTERARERVKRIAIGH
ncbi:MAG: Hsp20/alpha crystallin family protein [Pseudomonadota bacterium]